VHKERDEKEQVVFNQAMKVLERMMSHEKKMNDFMSIKCNDRSEFKLDEADRLERGLTDLSCFVNEEFEKKQNDTKIETRVE